MKAKPIRYTLIVSIILVFTGVAVAFAHGGRWQSGDDDFGDCPGMMGYGPGMMGYGPHRNYHEGGRGYGVELTDEQRDQLQAAREKFHADTEKLRDQIREKQYALHNEIAKETPDEAKVIKLQKELSGLRGEFDQKAIQHRLEVNKILPDNVRKYGRGYGRGGGNCWR
jgi:Spy/CpxP family protein refolding chaperone